jgi:ABC-type branched-subunit amino acid transport system ATPase component
VSRLLVVRGVSKRFGGVSALDNVSLEVDAGAIVGLIGPNGAGKTTLFNIVSGLLRADAGSIQFDGHEIGRLPAYRRAALGIGRSFQHLGLVGNESVATNLMTALHRSAPYSGADVILRPRRRDRGERYLAERCARSLERFGLLADRSRLVSELPFAKARFVELAAVVAEQPRLMLLDEPTTGLDLAEVVKLSSLLAEMREGGTTLVIVAHDVGFVMRLCDQIYVLAEGCVLFHGEPSAVRSDPAVIEAYLGRSA